MTPDATHLVQIEKPVYGGAFLARLEGKAVFVPLALPGEQAQVRILEDKRGYATAEADAIVHAAPERIAPGCRHFGACGGCQYQHATYDAQLRFKQAILRETLERGGVQVAEEIAVLAAEPWRYRNRIRLAFDAAGNFGYRGRRSHALVPIEECPISAPILTRAAEAFNAARRAVTPALRPTELSLFCTPDETQVLATLSMSAGPRVRFEDLAEAWSQRLPELKGAELAVTGRDRRQPPRTAARWGAVWLMYRAAGFDYRVDHGSFFQVNRWLVDGLVDRVTSGHSGVLAWDLFAGGGLFARKLADSFDEVVAVESAPPAAAAIEQNLRGTRGKAVKADSLAFLRAQKTAAPDLIVVDPPRTGLGREVTAELLRLRAPGIVYVSCDPATLARDLRALLPAYGIRSIALADLFPQTFHLETVVELRRS